MSEWSRLDQKDSNGQPRSLDAYDSHTDWIKLTWEEYYLHKRR